MANVVEIVVQGSDRTGPAMSSAINNTRRVSAEMRGLGQAFSQAGNMANQFGNTQLAGVINQLDHTLLSMAGLTKEVAKSKAGIAALAVAASAGGWAIGEVLRPYIVPA